MPGRWERCGQPADEAIRPETPVVHTGVPAPRAAAQPGRGSGRRAAALLAAGQPIGQLAELGFVQVRDQRVGELAAAPDDEVEAAAALRSRGFAGRPVEARGRDGRRARWCAAGACTRRRRPCGRGTARWRRRRAGSHRLHPARAARSGPGLRTRASPVHSAALDVERVRAGDDAQVIGQRLLHDRRWPGRLAAVDGEHEEGHRGRGHSTGRPVSLPRGCACAPTCAPAR